MELIDAVETRKLVFDEFGSTFEKQLLALDALVAKGVEVLKQQSTDSNLGRQVMSERDHSSRQAMHALRVITQTLSQLELFRTKPAQTLESSSARSLAETVALDQLSNMLETERAKTRRLEDLLQARRPPPTELPGASRASTAELEQQRDLVQQLQNELASVRAQNTAELEQERDFVRQLQDELASLRVQSGRVDEVERQLHTLKSQNIDLHGMHASAELETEKLRTENGALRAQVQALTSAAASSLAETAAKQQQLEANASELQSLRVDLHASHEAMAAEAQLLRKENDALITAVHDAHSYAEEMFALKEEVATEAQRVLRENDDLKQKLRELEATTATSREESLVVAERLLSENDDLKQLLQRARAESAALIATSRGTTADMEQLRSELDGLKLSVDSKTATSQAIASENDMLREQLRCMQSANAEIALSAEVARAETGQLRSENEFLAQRMQDIQTESAQALSTRENTAVAAQQMLTELRIEIRRLHAENKELCSFSEECELSAQKASAEALTDANGLKQVLARVTNDLEIRTAELDDLQQRLSECENGLAESLSREAAAVRLAAMRAGVIKAMEDEAQKHVQATVPGLSALSRGTASHGPTAEAGRFERSGEGEILGTLDQVRSQLESSLMDLGSMSLSYECRAEPEALENDQLTMLRQLMHSSRCSTREATTIAVEAAMASEQAANALQEAREANEVLRLEVRRLEAAYGELQNECEHLRARLHHTLDELSLVQARHAEAAYEIVPSLKQELEQVRFELVDVVTSREDCKVRACSRCWRCMQYSECRHLVVLPPF
jgi:chromosome segregation ATPase